MAELGARWALRQWGGYYRYAPHWRLEHRIDEAIAPQLPRRPRLEINRDGERGDPPPRPGERALRVLVVGGSAAECYFLDQSQTWAAVAQRVLNEPSSLKVLGVERVHVGNVSRAILACEDLANLLDKILRRYPRLDALVLMVGGADVVRWVERGMPASIQLEPPSLARLYMEHPEGPWGWNPRDTALWQLARSLGRRTLRPTVTNPDGLGWLARLRKMRAEAPVRVDDVPDPAPMLDHFEASLRSLVAVARARTDRLVVVRQPWFGPSPTPDEEAMFWNFGLGRPYHETVTSYLTPCAVDALMRRMDARAARVAVSVGAAQVDTTASLERSARTFYDELHLTPRGAEIVGRLVGDALLATLSKRVVVPPKAVSAAFASP
jgi:hypothetical protein